MRNAKHDQGGYRRGARKRRDARYRQVTADRDKVAGAGLIFFACPDCGKAQFTTRAAARRFARRRYPGAELSPYLAQYCGDGTLFHLTSQDAAEREQFKHQSGRGRDSA